MRFMFPRVHRNVLLEYLNVCLHFLYDAWPFLTCKHSQKYDDEEFKPYIHTHPSFNLYPPKCFTNAATQPCQDKPLLELAFQPAVKEYMYIFFWYIYIIYTYVYRMHSTGKDRWWETRPPSQRCQAPTSPTTTCPDWILDRP